MAREYAIQPQHLIDIILDSRTVLNVEYDPLIPEYVDCVLRAGMVRMSDLLWSLLKHSTISQEQPSDTTTKRPSTVMSDYKIILDLTFAATAGLVPDTYACAVNTFTAISSWVLDLLAWNDNKGESGSEQQPGALTNSSDALAMFESLGILFATLSVTEHGASALSTVKDGKCDSFQSLYKMCRF